MRFVCSIQTDRAHTTHSVFTIDAASELCTIHVSLFRFVWEIRVFFSLGPFRNGASRRVADDDDDDGL